MEDDDEVIRKMGRKLKLHKRRKTQSSIPQSYYDEGLGDLLELVDNKPKERVKKDRKVKQDDKKWGTFDESVSSGSKISKRMSMPESSTVAIVTKSTEAEKTNEKLKDLQRYIRGQINRITMANLPSITSSIENTYQECSLFEVNESICKCIQGLIMMDNALCPMKLVSELALLIAALQVNVGDEVAGHAIHYFVEIFDKLVKEPANLESKKLDNVVSLFCHFYAVSIFDSSFILELMNQFLDNFNEKSVEILLNMLIAIGFIFRKNAPAQMKQLIQSVNMKSNEAQLNINNKRMEFMLETLTEIRNNNIIKVTSKCSGVIFPIEREDLKNVLKNCLKKATKVTPIPVTYKQALSSNRWWIKVGSLKERQSQEPNSSKTKDQRGTKRTADEFILEGDREEKLCRMLRLNTSPLRRSLFKALITSSDIVEASSRMIAICNKQSSSEATSVILQVALHESTYNPFYTHLFSRLSNFDRKFKLSTHFTIMDKIQSIESMSEKLKTRLIEIIVQLLVLKVVSLSVLKCVEFSDLNETYVEFVKSIIHGVMGQEESVMKEIFDRIPNKDKSFASSIKLFISCFMDEKCNSLGKEMIKARIKMKNKNEDVVFDDTDLLDEDDDVDD